MTTGLPIFLVAELRITFRQCAHQHKCNRIRQFSSRRSPLPLKPKSKTAPASSNTASSETKKAKAQDDRIDAQPRTGTIHTTSEPNSYDIKTQQSRELVPRSLGERAVGSRRTVDAPIKVIPKADVTPNLRLTPKERLHIEILTRRAPPVVKQIKPYKERLLIYHHGNGKEVITIFLKVFCLVCAGFTTAVLAPAYYSAGNPLWLCGTFLVCGWLPAFAFHYILKPNITRVFLRLPKNARASPEHAMKYAKNLPPTARLDLYFTRITGLPGNVTTELADLQPISAISRRLWRPANVRWVGNFVDRGRWFRPNPTEFFLAPRVGPGKAKRDVIPGIWSEVYNRITGVTKEQASRWKQTK